ncbi:multidrug resistance protein A [Actinomycetospora sp. NBRC 106375]|uniref:efflux RND transporter periplasmic adaptor subunit n=1 Tax=Actinomycetospora sp. NBRC 106375 TaxID=3032207 RepID=UPI0024A0EFBE|nr:efflux RND transporter periplasmic adaptor subunit [Actinomycetospora sp. NBRC 106375]GLZ44018.1 multidrug resistance protein A [Actinomycetospora sp. NBRC 106375]
MSAGPGGTDRPGTDGADTGSVATQTSEATESGEGESTEGGGRRSMSRRTRIALAIILLVAVLAAIGFTLSYFLDARQYVSTDNAQVDGTQIPIVAPTSGTLVGWTGTQGAVLRPEQVVGRVEIDGGYVRPQRPIRAPAAGTVATSDTTDGAYVTAGQQLAIAYDPGDVYVTARIDETDINDVRPGQTVDFTVDAYGDRTFTGSVREVQGGAAGVFSPLPQSNSSGNFQKVTQVIPVKIAIDDLQGLELIPGMNVEVNIHKNG